ncbi:MAG: bifunctional aldolase/short-chain dehydrogenase [Candidatus Tectomicrobia bacterium]|nr:bifunctional aldolase/short-chain dehydrogenase [Candidatus Tectomicrobia bacterium]
MKSLWDADEARACAGDALALRVYTSRLLGREPDLVLHGGGNTSLKMKAANFFGDLEEVLYVKGSGWDLATIEAAGFAPVRLQVLRRMAGVARMSDAEMVRVQRAAMLDPNAPNPSVEAILHAIIPRAYVDHTHADAVVAITNTDAGEERMREIYGARVLIVPYVMPGFILARRVYEMTRDLDWSAFEGMVLLNHGVFTFADEARASYERMIGLVSEAEDYLERRGVLRVLLAAEPPPALPLLPLARFRRAASSVRGAPLVVRLEAGAAARGFAERPDVSAIASRGPLTPDHIIRTKRLPVIMGDDAEEEVARYADAYRRYFERHAAPRLTRLDAAPRWAVWPGYGTLALGRSAHEALVVADIVAHTIRAIQWGEALGGWRALPEEELFDVEYWELEQAKLAKGAASAPFQGKVALVTGGASGIGRACAEALRAQGAAVAALDKNDEVTRLFAGRDAVGVTCDVTDASAVATAVEGVVEAFGGLDLLISNAGIFPASRSIAEMDAATWSRSLEVNLSSHQRLLQACIPYLEVGLEPAVIVVGSKNVPAPGPGAAAYSVAKAGLTQLARVAALELAGSGIRVNVVHPNAVFDTGIWTPEVLRERAARYGQSVEEYKTSNLLKVEVTASDVAQVVCALAGPVFAKTTGAQIPVDGGNERVI